MTPDDIKDIPDGTLVRLTVEGRLAREYGGPGCWITAGGDNLRLTYSGNESSAYALRMATAIEVLSEPVTEPTGDYAIVRDCNGTTWVALPADRIYQRRWASVGGAGGHYRWDRLVQYGEPLTIVSSGVDERPATDDYVAKRGAEKRCACVNCGRSDAACTKRVLTGGKACCSACESTDTHPLPGDD